MSALSIVARLRAGGYYLTKTPPIHVEAADTIEALVEALKITLHEVEAMIPCVYHEITRNEMQASAGKARAALAKVNGQAPLADMVSV